MMKHLCLTVFVLLFAGIAALAQHQVTGTITDANTGDPLPGATVRVQGTTTGSISDPDGTYRINVPDPNATLVFSFVGYRTETVNLNGRSEVDIALEESIEELDEVVVIGYGERQKKDVTTSVSSVRSENIEKIASISPELAMQGQMPGIHVTSGGGSPTSRPTVRVRGVNTWGVAEPLYVIDGVPITEYGSGSAGQYGGGAGSASRVQDLRSPVNIMALINPNDIESISVLKDASAAAIYGVRAANGVVLINTKSGEAGEMRISFNAQYGVQNLPEKYDVLNVEKYTALYQEAYENNPAETENMPTVFDPESPDYLGDMSTVDWQTPFLNENATKADYSLRVSGGNEDLNYYLSTGYTFQEGSYINDNLERYNVAANINSNVTDYIRAGLNYKFSNAEALAESGKSFQANLQTGAFSRPPWQEIYDPEGPPERMGFMPVIDTTLVMTEKVEAVKEGDQAVLDTSMVPRIIFGDKLYGPETGSNHFGEMTLNQRTYELMRHIGRLFVEVEPIENLTFKGTVSADWYMNRRMTWSDVDAFIFGETPSDPTNLADPDALDTEGEYGERLTRNYNLTKEFTINYSNTFGNHNVDLVLNAMDQQYGFDNMAGGTELLTTDDSWLRRVPETEREYNNVFTDIDQFALQGYMGRLSYNYANRYYADVTVRRDGTSKFAPENRWGTFPSFSLAWRISDEPFMAGFRWLNDMKLRYGWGQLGNQETKAFAFLSTISKDATYDFGSDPKARYVPGMGYLYWAATMPEFPNPDLRWETTTTHNVGFDAFLFNSLGITFEYYHKITDGILQQSKLPGSVGYDIVGHRSETGDPIINVAEVLNNGIELQLDYHGRLGELRYHLSGNLTTTHNEVLEMYDDAPIGGQGGRIEEGYPINYLWGYEVDGMFTSQQEVDEWQANYEDKNISQQAPGDLYFKDTRGNPDEENPYYTEEPDNVVNQYDRVFIGKTIPGYYYGFSLSTQYKGFDFSAFFNGVGDIQKVNGARQTGEGMSSMGINQLTTVKNRWTPENPDTDMPRAAASDPAANNRFSDRWVEDADYLRLGTLQIGYTLPRKVYDALGFTRQFRIYVSSSNLFTYAPGWSGIDPENEAVPTPRAFSVGVNATF